MSCPHQVVFLHECQAQGGRMPSIMRFHKVHVPHLVADYYLWAKLSGPLSVQIMLFSQCWSSGNGFSSYRVLKLMAFSVVQASNTAVISIPANMILTISSYTFGASIDSVTVLKTARMNLSFNDVPVPEILNSLVAIGNPYIVPIS